MRGESDRECRAKGGRTVKWNAPGSEVWKGLHSNKPVTGKVDASTKRGAGPLFRKRGGHIPEAFKEDEFRDDKATGGAISGAGSKPSMGRAGRKTGGGVGADLKPLTHPTNPRKPPGRKYMGDGERTP